MKRLILRAALVLALACSVGLAAQSPAAAARHSGPNWVWFGPASWDAAYGTYGITITGGNGAVLDLGFSTTICSPGATWNDSVAAYFKARRQQARQSGWRFTASPIGHPSGTSDTYRRQVLTGTNNAQGAKRGVLIFEYDFTTNTDGVNYCYQRNVAKYSNANRWNRLRTTLNQVQNSLAYSGPGA